MADSNRQGDVAKLEGIENEERGQGGAGDVYVRRRVAGKEIDG